VRPLTDRDREILEAIPVDEEAVKADLGLSALATDTDNEYVERLLCHPNLNVAGLDAGYDGEGHEDRVTVARSSEDRLPPGCRSGSR